MGDDTQVRDEGLEKKCFYKLPGLVSSGSGCKELCDAKNTSCRRYIEWEYTPTGATASPNYR